MATTMGLASVEELSERFAVTSSTIRRDLARLTESGRLARTYGGVIAVPHHREAPLDERAGESHDAKRGIGLWAASQVVSGQTILLDGGTTNAELAFALRSVSPLEVVTPSLTAVNTLSGVTGVDVYCLGGRLRDISQSFVGPMAEAALERLSFDIAFLGADAVTADRGICEATLEQTRLKEVMAHRSSKVFVLAHAAKLGEAPFNAWTPFQPHWVLVTDDGASGGQVEAFQSAGYQCVVVDESGQEVAR